MLKQELPTCYGGEENTHKNSPRCETVHQDIGLWILATEVVLRLIRAIRDDIPGVVIVIEDILHEDSTGYPTHSRGKSHIIVAKVFITVIILLRCLVLEK